MAVNAPIHTFLEFFLPVLHTVFFLGSCPHNYCQNNGQQWEKEGSCSNDYHQFSERILGIKPVTSCSQVLYANNRALGLGRRNARYVSDRLENIVWQEERVIYKHCRLKKCFKKPTLWFWKLDASIGVIIYCNCFS